MLALLSLFLAAFSVGTTEYVIAGLLPEISRDLAVTIPEAGLLVTGYAVGVAVGGPVVSLIVSHFPRKPAMLGLMAIFIGGHVLCALAPTYGLMMAARVFIALSHGSFFGLAGIVAVAVAAPEKRGSALSLVFSGLTIATVIGVPAGTAIGNAFGWRMTFWAVATLAVIATAAMAVALPKGVARQEAPSTLGGQLRVLLRPTVYVTFAIMIVMAIGFFSFFTFVSPFLIETAGMPESNVAWILLLFGLGSTAGIFVGGKLADLNGRFTLIFTLPVLAVVYAALAIFGGNAVVASVLVFAFGAIAFSAMPTLQARILSRAADAPDLASTLVSTAFNIGIAIGATAGAVALTNGVPYAQLPWIGFAMALGATALATLAAWIDQRAAAMPAAA